MSHVPRDVILLPESTPQHPDRWVAMNVFARTCLGISSDVVRFLGQTGSSPATTGAATYVCWDIEWFSNEAGLLADPSRFRRDPEQWRALTLDEEALVAKLKAHFILIDDEGAYRARFQHKKNVLDSGHFGNFHQQHGQHMLLSKRKDPASWWMDQKFTADRRFVRDDNLYGAVQWSFLERYFKRRIVPGATVVDLGCGTGIYSNLMAQCGAEVRGVDPSDKYLEVARANAVPNVSFVNANIGETGALDGLADGWADLIFMSDSLLFYFVPMFSGQKADLPILLRDIRRILKPGGAFISLEPHAAFYMNPWLGDEDRPFTVVTEYLHRNFGIVPPISWLAEKFSNAGFAIKELLEIGPAEYFEKVDPRAYHFAREFPLWQLLEFTATDRR